MRTGEELRAALRQHFWYHCIELRPGIVTPGVAGGAHTLPYYGIPADLSGKTVLDIGCWDGFFSFECEKRGAERVVGADNWENAGRGAFDFARTELGSRVEPLECDIYDLPGTLGGERFDVVLFLGVLYHLRHPLLALEKVAAVTAPGGLAIVETVVDLETAVLSRPVMAFFPGRELNDDPTSWWAPNPAAVAKMLMACGFSEVLNNIQVWQGNRSIFHALKMSDAQVERERQRDHRDRHRRPPVRR